MDFDAINAQIDPLDQAAMKRAVDHWNVTFKPIGGLGVLEEIIVQIAGITGDERVCLDKRIGIPMCADNGVVEEGVTQTDQAMTAIVTANMGKGLSSVCVMGRIANMDVRPVDVGIAGDEPLEGVLDRKIMRGTNNMARGPACTREQVEQAIQVGIDMVGQVKAEGYKIVVSGEMGIGNTTTCSAVASVLLGMDPETVTGRGAGLSSAGLERKVAAIKRAIELNRPDCDDAVDVIAKVGGLDIAAMMGTFLGGAIHRVPVLIDGAISSVAALCAVRACPASRCAMIATHASSEPVALAVMEELGLRPVIDAKLHLGEGTGAVCLLPMLDMALVVYDGVSFGTMELEAYEVDPQ